MNYSAAAAAEERYTLQPMLPLHLLRQQQQQPQPQVMEEGRRWH